jgi:MFS family permease
MEDIKRLGDPALKLERYRYNLIAFLSWIVFGMIFASAIMLFNALMLFDFTQHVIFATIVPAGIISVILSYKIRKIVIPKTNERWKKTWIFYALSFVLAYCVVPYFVKLTPLQYSLYYSLAWYPSLGVAFVVVGVYAERRDEMLVTKTMLPAGIAMILTTIPLVVLCKYVKDYTDVLAVGLIATAMMVMIYLICAIYSFFKGYRVLFD